MSTVVLWHVYETVLQGYVEHENPFWDITVYTDFYSPSSRKITVEAFWDGDDTWRVRFSPDEIGEWKWVSRCTETADTGLNGQTGYFTCEQFASDNPFYRHGPLKISGNGRFIMHHDGTPFFWLADTAWNGVLRADPEDWDSYLAKRRAQGFTAIQFVSTNWRGLAEDALGEAAFSYAGTVKINPAFFRRLDDKVDAINRHGLVAVPVILWACTEQDPGRSLSQEGAKRLARYIVARWGAAHVVWILAGDGDYSGENAGRWIVIGRDVFGDRHTRLVTLHNCGLSWQDDSFRQESWFDFVGYQSGHGDAEKDLRWLLDGPPGHSWKVEPPKPAINLEPNYEGFPSYNTGEPFSAFNVRRAAYWSLLIGPPAGVSYGNNPVWVWLEQSGEAEGHLNLPEIPSWREGLETEGISCMSVLHKFFTNIKWWEFMPAPELLTSQPGKRDPAHAVVAAMNADATNAIAYTPAGKAITIARSMLDNCENAGWLDPRTGSWTEAKAQGDDPATFIPPDDRDWVLWLGEV